VTKRVKNYVRKTHATRREEIIEAALELLGEHGIEGTTVTRIAETVGVTPAALYRHFGSRDAILAAAVDAASHKALTWIDSSPEPDMLARLQQLGRSHAGWARDHVDTMARPLFQALSLSQEPGSGMHPDSWPAYERLMAFVEEGKRQGTIRLDVESMDVAWAMLSCAYMQDMALLLGADGSVVEGALARNLQRLLETFRPPGAGA
jgi:AcrR family transcriptional regulator